MSSEIDSFGLGGAGAWREGLRRWRRWPGAALQRLATPAYALYEKLLRDQVRLRPPPHHVGIILDGNRRYARRAGLPDAGEAYRLGARKLDDVIAWCVELGIPAVTLWVCSPENLERPSEQVAGIMAAIEGKMKALITDPAVHRLRIRVRAIGRLALLPQSTQTCLRAAEQATAAYDGMLISIAVAYGGREEITDAVRQILSTAAREGTSLETLARGLAPEDIEKHLYLAGAPEPDLIIRTSGEVRLSGFLLWQSAASEFYFSDVLWPEFRRIDFLRAIRSFQQRSRRFGL